MRLFVLALVLTASLLCAPAHPVVPLAAQPSSHFDIAAATNAWLATVPPDARHRSDAYFEGGTWLMLWDLLYGVAVYFALLQTGISARMRDWAERVTRFPFLQFFLYWIQFLLITSVVTFPLTVYEGFFREHQYGLLNQNFVEWFGEQMIGLALAAVLGGLAVATLVLVIRSLPRTWHIWGTAVAVIFALLSALIFPVFVAPLFNTYKPLQNAAIKARILGMAHANGIPVSDVLENNASKQSKRVSANVSGIFGTDRITLNDNLMNRVSPAGIMAVMGHEMGHYVMHHIYNSVAYACIGIFLMMSILRWGLEWSRLTFGNRWGIRDDWDVALLPAAAIIISVVGTLTTPVANTITRTQEYEADIFGLDASRQPDGEAEVDLLLGEYRKLDPTPFEEFVFFDHPSGRTRITAAMRWKAENLCLFDPSLPCVNADNQSAASGTK